MKNLWKKTSMYYIKVLLLVPLFIIFWKWNIKEFMNWLITHKHIFWKSRQDGFKNCIHSWCNTIKMPDNFLNFK